MLKPEKKASRIYFLSRTSVDQTIETINYTKESSLNSQRFIETQNFHLGENALNAWHSHPVQFRVHPRGRKSIKAAPLAKLI